MAFQPGPKRLAISRRAWHYRLYNSWQNFYEMGADALRPRRWRKHPGPGWHYPRSLCSYFWAIVLLTLGFIPILLVLLFFAAVSYLILGITVLVELCRKHKAKKPAKRRTPKLVVAYLKAHKEKVCPLIDITD